MASLWKLLAQLSPRQLKQAQATQKQSPQGAVCKPNSFINHSVTDGPSIPSSMSTVMYMDHQSMYVVRTALGCIYTTVKTKIHPQLCSLRPKPLKMLN